MFQRQTLLQALPAPVASLRACAAAPDRHGARLGGNQRVLRGVTGTTGQERGAFDKKSSSQTQDSTNKHGALYQKNRGALINVLSQRDRFNQTRM